MIDYLCQSILLADDLGCIHVNLVVYRTYYSNNISGGTDISDIDHCAMVPLVPLVAYLPNKTTSFRNRLRDSFARNLLDYSTHTKSLFMLIKGFPMTPPYSLGVIIMTSVYSVDLSATPPVSG